MSESDDALREKVNKQSKMLEMSKRAIDDLKMKIENKDTIIEKLSVKAKESLTKAEARIKELESFIESNKSEVSSSSSSDIIREPKSVLQRVKHGNKIWCLLAFDKSNGEGKDSSGWYLEDKLLDAEETYGVELFLPDIAISADEVTSLKRQLENANESENKMKEEFRRYKVRSEIMIRQQQDDLSRLSDADFLERTQKISGEDNATLLKRAEAKIIELEEKCTTKELNIKNLQSQLESSIDERVELQDDLSGVMEENEKLKGSVASLEKQVNSLIAESKSSKIMDIVQHKREDEEINKVKAEYNEYKNRSMRALKEREDHLERLGSSLNEARRSNSFVSTPASERKRMSNETVGAVELPPPEVEYIKNVVLQYMCAEDEVMKLSMERALATVLRFNEAETKALQAQKKSTSSWF